jgi:hypothetical protein
VLAWTRPFRPTAQSNAGLAQKTEMLSNAAEYYRVEQAFRPAVKSHKQRAFRL